MKEMTALDASRVAELVRKVWKAFDLVRGNIPSSDFHVILFVLSLVKDGLINRELLREDAILNHIQEIGTSEKYRLIWPHYERLVTAVPDRILVRLFDYLLSIDREALEKYFPAIFDGILEVISDFEGKRGDFWMMPKELTYLVRSFAPAKSCLKVYNPFAGLCSFGLLEGPNNQVIAQEINSSIVALAKLRLLAHSRNSDYAILEDSIENWREGMFDFIVSAPPLNMKLDKERLIRKGSSQRNVDAFILERARKQLSEVGVAVVVVPSRMLFAGGVEEHLRERLIEEDVLDMVISLPGQLLHNTGISVSLIVLNRNKRFPGVVRMIDATDKYEGSARSRVLNVKEVQGLVESEVESSENVFVSPKEIAEQDYILMPTRFVKLQSVENEEGDLTSFSLVANRIRLRARMHESGTLVRIGDLSNSEYFEATDFTHLDDSVSTRSSRLLNQDALLVATRGNNLKPSIFQFGGEPILLSDGIEAFEIDTSLIDLDYLVFQLGQKYVQDQLEAISMGAVIASIRIKDLENLKLRVPELEVQRELMKNVKETILRKHAEESKLIASKLGLSDSIKEQNSFLRHTMAGPLTNVCGSVRDIQDILGHLANQNPEIWNTKAHPKSELNLGELMKIVSYNLSEIQTRTSRSAQKEDWVEDEVLKVIKLIPYLKRYFQVQRMAQPEIQFELDIDTETLVGSGQKASDIQMLGTERLLNTMLDNFIENAKAHAFEGNSDIKRHRIEVMLQFDEDLKKASLEISNTGNRLPENFDLGTFSLKGASLGENKGDGYGGWLISKIVSKLDSELVIVYDEQDGYEGVGGDLASSFVIDIPLVTSITEI